MITLFTLFAFCSLVYGEVGCSDDGCICHPDTECHPAYATNNPCHNTAYNCYGPVIVTVFEIEVNESVANSLLPNGLEVIKNKLGLYPLEMMFNQQHNVATWNYLEFILSLGNIQWNDQEKDKYEYRGPFSYGAQLFLDELGPTLGGQAYGVNKIWTNISQSCNDEGDCQYTVYEKESDEILMTAAWTPKPTNAKYGNATENKNFWNVQRPGFTSPMIAEYPVNEGVFQCGECDWFLENALIQPVIGNFTIHKSFIGKLPTGTFTFEHTIDTIPTGAYRMETMWMFEDKASPTKETCTTFMPNITVY